MKKAAVILCCMAVILLASSCNDTFAGRVVNILYTNSSASRSLPAYSSSEYDYSVFGDLVAEITPTKFKLPILKIVLFNDAEGTFEEPTTALHNIDYETGPDERFYGDFLSSTPITYTPELSIGTFNSLFMHIPGSAGQITYGTSEEYGFSWNPSAEIEFILPAVYSGETLDIVGEAAYDPDDPNCTYITKDGVTIFTNGLSKIYYNAFSSNIDQYIFGENLTAGIYNDDMANINPGEIFNCMDLPGATNQPILTAGFTPITIPENFEELNITFSFDIENLIQLYDNKTPADKTDDIFMVAPELWNRISVTYEIVE